MGFFIEALFGGLMAGMLYSLVALGFVLIFKASGVFNFAQGAMVLFAALAMARFAEWVPQWLGLESKLLGNIIAFALAAACMYVLAWLIERLVLRHLVNQEGVTLLMATLGITYFLDGLGQTIFGSAIYQIDVGMPKEPVFLFEGMFPGGVLINLEDVYAACIAAVMVAILSLFFQKTSTGRALRAVADDHQAAHSPSAFRSTASGSLFGLWQVSPPSLPASSGVPKLACSSRSQLWRSRHCPSSSWAASRRCQEPSSVDW
jgi:branched-chain amino acid transport system permease protein